MLRRNRQVSLAWLGAALCGALGLLGTGPAHELTDTIAPPTEVIDAGQSAGFGCRVVKELRFEMLPANAEPPLPIPRRAPVCLAVYVPTPDGDSADGQR